MLLAKKGNRNGQKKFFIFSGDRHSRDRPNRVESYSPNNSAIFHKKRTKIIYLESNNKIYSSREQRTNKEEWKRNKKLNVKFKGKLEDLVLFFSFFVTFWTFPFCLSFVTRSPSMISKKEMWWKMAETHYQSSGYLFFFSVLRFHSKLSPLTTLWNQTKPLFMKWIFLRPKKFYKILQFNKKKSAIFSFKS